MFCVGGFFCCYDHDLTFNIHENADGESFCLAIAAETHHKITHEYKSYIKLQLKMRANFEENRTNLAVLVDDDTSFTGLHFEMDELASECDINSFESLRNGSNNGSIVIPHIDNITWYLHSSVVFCDPNLETLTTNEIDIKYYFDPLLESSAYETYANVERVHTGGVTIDSGCGWNNRYKHKQELIIFILLNDSFVFSFVFSDYNYTLAIDDITNITDILNVTIIKQIDTQFCIDDINMYQLKHVLNKIKTHPASFQKLILFQVFLITAELAIGSTQVMFLFFFVFFFV